MLVWAYVLLAVSWHVVNTVMALVVKLGLWSIGLCSTMFMLAVRWLVANCAWSNDLWSTELVLGGQMAGMYLGLCLCSVGLCSTVLMHVVN